MSSNGVNATRFVVFMVISCLAVLLILAGYEQLPHLHYGGVVDKLHSLLTSHIPDTTDTTYDDKRNCATMDNTTTPTNSSTPSLCSTDNKQRLLLPTRSLQHITATLHTMQAFMSTFLSDINALRDSYIKANIAWSYSNIEIVSLANAYDADYFDTIAKYPQVKTFFLHISKEQMTKSLSSHNKYYQYASNNCDYLEEKAIYGQRKGVDFFNTSCQSRFDGLLDVHHLMPVQLRVGLPKEFRLKAGQQVLTFMHVIRNAIVKSTGDVFVSSLKILPQRCEQNKKFSYLTKPDNLLLYDEVLTIAQFWGWGFFHCMVENLPRIAPYITFLKDHPQIKVHVETVTSFENSILEKLGISGERVIAGEIRARILYLPAGTACGRPNFFNTQLLSLYYRESIPTPPQPRNSIVIIKRSSKRYLNRHTDIYNMVEKIARNKGFEVETFGDTPVPPLHEAMAMFNRAWMIIGPHGAGLANSIFAEPGTVVLEVLCNVNGNYNLCYRNLDAQLGHRHYVIIDKGNSCLETKPQQIQPALLYYISAIDHR